MDRTFSLAKWASVILAGFIPTTGLAQIQLLYSLGTSLDGGPGGLTRAADGSFYGVLGSGGRLGRGSIFHFDPDANLFSTVFDFAEASTNANVTAGPLVALTNGLIYGVLTDFPETGATNVLYRVGVAGSGFSLVAGLPAIYRTLLLASDGSFYLSTPSELDRFQADFTGYVALTNGFDLSRLLEGSDGWLYGLAGSQTIIRIHKDGSALTQLTNTVRGTLSLIQGSDAQLYGLQDNFPDGELAVKLETDGTGFQSLGAISADGQDSLGGSLLDGEDGRLYATFSVGPLAPSTRLITISQTGGVITLVDLPATYGNNSGGQSITLGTDGRLYGTASQGGDRGGGVLYSVNRDGSELQERLQFGGAAGSFVQSALILGSDGWLYGAARQGGLGNRGMIFRLMTNGGRFTVLKEFASSAEGDSPRGGVIEGPGGALYGTTDAGGIHGRGTVFRLNLDGSGFLTLAHLDASSGTNPVAQLLLTGDGTLFGSCISGGPTATNGTLWKIPTNGAAVLLLKKFAIDGHEGRRPFAPLIEGADGFLYGVTDGGGSAEKGVVFKLSKDGSSYQVLRNLQGFGDAANPEGRLLQLPDGALIGTSTAGGTAGLGSIFRIQTNGSGYQVIHSFVATNGEARGPVGGLSAAGDGSLVGTTRFGGGQAVGTVFTIQPDGGGYQIVYRFSTNYPSGQEPWAALTPAPNGVFYGATTLGGLAFSGIIFQLQTGASSLPMLAIGSEGQSAKVEWPASASGYQLQVNSELANDGGWQVVLDTPTLSNNVYELKVPFSATRGFFRLKRF